MMSGFKGAEVRRINSNHKLYISMILTVVFLALAQTDAPAKTRSPTDSRRGQNPFAVTAIGIKPDRDRYAGSCPTTIGFTGFITTNGPGTVTYTISGPGISSIAQELIFKEAGTQVVSATATISESIDGEAMLRIMAPNFMEQRLRPGSYVVACQAHFKVIFRSFTVNHQTRDDMLNRDGWADEVFNWITSFDVNRSGQAATHENVLGLPMGDLRAPNNHILAGTATSEGGLKTGDHFPQPATYPARFPVPVATATADHTAIPGVVYDGVLTQGETAAAIFVTLWEWDNDFSPLIDQYRAMLARNLGPAVVPFIRTRSNQSITVKTGTELGLVRSVFLGTGPFGLGEVNSRPIGMIRDQTTRDVRYTFDPKVIVLTYETGLAAARNGTIFEIGYVDDPALEGDYSLFFQVIASP